MANPFSNLEDRELMKLYIDGENMAFEVIYSRYSKNVYSYLNKRMYDKSSVDDLFQKTFIKFHRSKEIYDPEHQLLKWIYVICRSELLDFLKKKSIKIVSMEENQFGNEAPIDDNNDIDILNEATLTKNERDALNFRYFNDEEFISISKKLNTSESNVRKIISRAIKKLKIKYVGDV